MKEFDTVDSGSASEAALEVLQRMILSGELKAGEWLLPERELAEKLGVSRGSLHKAILALEYRGFLSVVPRRGTMVNDFRKRPTPQSLAALMNYSSTELEKGIFADMMDYRIWMEAECARRACHNIYESTLAEMRAIAQSLGKDGNDLTDQTFRFHYLLTQASGNSIFSMIFKGFEPAVRCLTRRRYEKSETDYCVTSRRMLSLTEAIASENEDAAERALRELLSFGIGLLEASYE